MTERCAMLDCIAPAAKTVTDGNGAYVFCEGHFTWFESYLTELRVERDRLVASGVDFDMANRIVQQRVEREEI